MSASCYIIISLETIALRVRRSDASELNSLIEYAIDACAQNGLICRGDFSQSVLEEELLVKGASSGVDDTSLRILAALIYDDVTQILSSIFSGATSIECVSRLNTYTYLYYCTY